MITIILNHHNKYAEVDMPAMYEELQLALWKLGLDRVPEKYTLQDLKATFRYQSPLEYFVLRLLEGGLTLLDAVSAIYSVIAPPRPIMTQVHILSSGFHSITELRQEIDRMIKSTARFGSTCFFPVRGWLVGVDGEMEPARDIGREVSQEQVQRVYENHGIDSRYTGPYEVSPTISARCGTGGNNVPLVSEEPPVYCIVGNVIDREPENGGNGCGYKENIAYTLTAMDRHAVFSRQRTDVFSENDVVSTESARQHKDATDLVMQPYQETVGTLVKSDHKGISNQYVNDDKCIVDEINLIRRLTPLECERLQGFPDGWTNIPSASDSARYKALGNSVAIPCVEFVMQGLALVLEYENEIRRRRRLWICYGRQQRCAA